MPDTDDGDLTIAVIADVQYTDKPSKLVHNSYGPYIRHYQACLSVFARIVRAINNGPDPPAALLHLGDIIDGSPTVSRSLADLTTVLRTFSRCRVPVHHVVGNHCLSVPRPILQRTIPAFDPSFYYARRLDKFWTLVVLDTCDVSVNGTDAERTEQGERLLASHPHAPNNRRWNGGVSDEQLRWLRDTLDALSGTCGGDGAPSYAVVATHIPLLPSAADATHVIFNGEEVSALLDSYSSVVRLVLSGHFHRGGSALSEKGIRHETIRGIVEDGGLQYCTLMGDGTFDIVSKLV